MNQQRPAQGQQLQQLQRQDEITSANNNENEACAEAANEQPMENAIETFVIDLNTQTSQTDHANSNNNINVVNDIRSLATAITADTAAPNCVDDVLILHYEQNNNNFNQNIPNNNLESQLMHFNGIHIRNNINNNSYICSCTNRFNCEHIQACDFPSPPDGSCDNARSSLFQSTVSAINSGDLVVRNHDLPLRSVNMHNTVADSNAAVVAGETLEDINNADEINGSEAVEPLLLALQLPNVGSANSAPVDSSPRLSNEFVSPEYLQNNRRSRRRRHGRGRGRSARARQRHQIRRSLKSMNSILRKTAYTLRRIKSLIMQQLQMARDYRMNVAMVM